MICVPIAESEVAERRELPRVGCTGRYECTNAPVQVAVCLLQYGDGDGDDWSCSEALPVTSSS